jgi:hypothetical protein
VDCLAFPSVRTFRFVSVWGSSLGFRNLNPLSVQGVEIYVDYPTFFISSDVWLHQLLHETSHDLSNFMNNI